MVKIGLVGPFEGRHRSIGYDVIYSARLAIREINEAGGIGGYRVELVALDDGGDPDLAVDAAAALVIDKDVVAAVGHWLPETTAAAANRYKEARLPLIIPDEAPFSLVNPNDLPEDFLTDYQAVTPFDEVAGPYAAAAYDAFQLLWLAMENAVEGEGRIDRQTLSQHLADVKIDGLTGTVYQSD